MAYIGNVTYDDGGRVRSLEGMGALYDNGRKRNLLGAELGAVSYDDGGRFRSLFGLGDDSFDIPMDLPLTPPSNFVPIQYMSPTPSPIFDTTSAEITGSLVPPSFGPAPPVFYQPLVSVDTQSAPITGGLVDPNPPAAAPAMQSLPAVASALTSIFGGIRNIFSSTGSAVRPASAGTIVGTVTPTGTVGTSWFSQPSVLGVPNWGMLAGIGVLGIGLMAAMKSGSGSLSSAPRRRNPRRRRNGMELILMGANPSRGRRWIQ